MGGVKTLREDCLEYKPSSVALEHENQRSNHVRVGLPRNQKQYITKQTAKLIRKNSTGMFHSWPGQSEQGRNYIGKGNLSISFVVTTMDVICLRRQ